MNAKTRQLYNLFFVNDDYRGKQVDDNITLFDVTNDKDEIKEIEDTIKKVTKKYRLISTRTTEKTTNIQILDIDL